MDSYAKGESTPALLEETIGTNLARTVASYADREALVESATGRRWTWAQLDADVDAVALPDAGTDQPARDGVDVGLQLRPGPAPPARALDQRLAVGVRRHRARQVGPDRLLQQRRNRLTLRV